MNLVLLVEPISPAEGRVLDQLAEGKSNQEIAVSLFLSRGTVRRHMSEILAKLDAHTRLEAVLKAQELGLVDAPDTLSAPALGILALLHAHPSALAELEAVGALRRGNGDPNGS